MSDIAEAQRYAQRHGLGEIIYEDPTSTDELAEMFDDLGLGSRND